jgi:hypothetical protein
MKPDDSSMKCMKFNRQEGAGEAMERTRYRNFTT